MTSKASLTKGSPSQRRAWVEQTFNLMPLLCAILTGTIITLQLQARLASGHAPHWAGHPGRIGLGATCLLVAFWGGYGAWLKWWHGHFLAMDRSRYHGLYRTSTIVGTILGTLLSFGGTLLLERYRVPPDVSGVLFLGFLATLMAAQLSGYYLLQGLARTQRDMLMQAQLAPHFLFNSLSTLKGLVAQDPAEAQAMADRLSHLFRDLMAMGEEATVPLGRELAFVEAYLGLEKARLGERLEVRIDVPEELEAFPVPPLCLQVLAENAVRHAIAPRIQGGRLSIRALRAGSGLQLLVTDPGDGTSAQTGSGRGLKVLRARLEMSGDLSFQCSAAGHTATLLVRPA